MSKLPLKDLLTLLRDGGYGDAPLTAELLYEKNLRLQAADMIASMVGLLEESAEKLQDYCAEVNGDINDPLAMRIKKLLEGV